MARHDFLKTAIPLVAVTAIGVYNLPPMTEQEKAVAAVEAEALASDEAKAARQAQQQFHARSQIERSVSYRYCSDVRSAGRAPLYRGQPGYAPHLDRDGDGVACEPYRGY